MSKADEQYADERDVWVDPVSHQPVDPATAEHQSVYAGHMYHFATLVSKQVFDENPQLWVSVPYASESSSALSPMDEGQ